MGKDSDRTDTVSQVDVGRRSGEARPVPGAVPDARGGATKDRCQALVRWLVAGVLDDGLPGWGHVGVELSKCGRGAWGLDSSGLTAGYKLFMREPAQSLARFCAR